MKKLLQFVLMLFILSSCYKKDIQLDDKLESDKVSVIGKKTRKSLFTKEYE